MARIVAVLALLAMGIPMALGQSGAYHSSIEKHRKKVEKEFRNPQKSALRDQAHTFTGNSYYPIDPAYKVLARVELTPGGEVFEIPTSNPERNKKYTRYAILHFTWEGQEHTLEVYRSVVLQGVRKYKDHLFLPFTDLTSGEDTYGGGRYLDLEVPDGETIVIDFNLAYNPYCAYRSDGWACPVPPVANRLSMAVKAGMKEYHGK
ncbi:MAG: DUF1684 domain-containing protein [Bacteroidia bacterium]|nr:DUF1684 domain-containing protein [Bacteroidia bacterium]